MDNKPDNPPAGDGAMVAVLRRVLRPLVALMIKRQLTYPFVSNLLKAIYVDVAEADFRIEGKKQTDSRISLLTGVHRKDVKRLRVEDRAPEETPAHISVGSQLVARWLGDRTYQNGAGHPRALPLRAHAASGEKSFDDLVEEIARQDIRPRVVLDELLRLGVVKELDDGRVALTTGAFTPSDSGQEEKLFFFGKNIQDHIRAGTHNLSGKKPAFFDRSVYYDQLSKESVDTLTQLCNHVGMDALVTVNQKALELQQQDRHSTGTRYRINFGIFNYSAEYDGEDASASGADTIKDPGDD